MHLLWVWSSIFWNQLNISLNSVQRLILSFWFVFRRLSSFSFYISSFSFSTFFCSPFFMFPRYCGKSDSTVILMPSIPFGNWHFNLYCIGIQTIWMMFNECNRVNVIAMAFVESINLKLYLKFYWFVSAFDNEKLIVVESTTMDANERMTTRKRKWKSNERTSWCFPSECLWFITLIFNHLKSSAHKIKWNTVTSMQFNEPTNEKKIFNFAPLISFNFKWNKGFRIANTFFPHFSFSSNYPVSTPYQDFCSLTDHHMNLKYK